MKQPVLYFDHYMLRDIELSDAKDMFEYGSDMEVVKYLSWGPYLDLTEAVGSIRKVFQKRPERGLPVGYAIVDLQNNKMIGTIDFHTKYADGSVEVGYCLNRHYWNKGVMTKALRKILEVGFWYFGYEKIIIGHSNENIGSKRVIEKNNFIFDRIDHEKYYNRFTGQKEPSSWYYLTKEQFK
ncbi:GNAT family N-acetyltransferase [Acholeplasma equirhinis]|uniref:GNAT family N-acetyltransferase n=1 Tax=Acholeplasma equirhinis TaxID=555393 RepID=UPI00197AD6C9|nr:GNAT family N-acetyltransferase [Acholeplasma equirhinis]MBN3490490.1 GNAT family N-acetyltransferase [Acholeplasma equirhinis]